jgi:hypothetical protein
MPKAPTPVPPPTPAAAPVFDNFSTYNSKLWEYADESLGTTDGCKVWYLKNHSLVDTTLSLNEGTGLKMLMSSVPCKSNPAACGGAKMAADHLTLKHYLLYGDYELRMRAPYTVGSGKDVSNGTYAYFTAGYGKTDGVWNEVYGSEP